MAAATRIGLVGCGFYAANHLHSWRDLAAEGAALSAVCDVDAAKAEAAGRAFNVPWYTDAAAMLDAVPLDLVDIATRQETHRALAELSLSRGIATIVQKPFAPTWDDCRAIVAAAERHSAWLAVHENFRFQAPMRRVKSVIQAGDIGAPSWARILFRTHFDVFRTQPYFYTEDRLAISDVGVHVLDLARVFLGEVERVSCETQRRNPKVRAEDTATMMLRHVSGAVSVVECSYMAARVPDPFPETLLEIEGESGLVQLLPGYLMAVKSGDAVRTEQVGAPLRPWTSHPWHVSQEGALGACRHFLDCVRRGVAAETSGRDNLKTYALVDAAYRAAAERRAVRPLAA
jgi:predicted dehydrogenase